MPVETAPQRAARLLAGRHPQIAAAVARQLQRTVPRYQNVNRQALERNILAILRGLDRLLAKGDEGTLRRTLDDIAELRATTGFGVDEIVMAGLCFLPVLRRYLVHQDEDMRRGLESYEAVEAIALPFFGHIAMYFQNLGDLSDPFVAEMEWSALTFPLAIEDVDDDEDTIRTRRPELG